uniref:NADH-ubiquinone oxidoreductase chain 5 n=1 Tax=Polyrhachis dives TaxID=84555 RepID=A0A1B0UTV0_9HYME|nr:NADH dehydrogenase subunit 5 [Polyrhachis dives]AMJ17072.1 NADH dehydrogenase subunit 5 [Polyrhachis dives]
MYLWVYYKVILSIFMYLLSLYLNYLDLSIMFEWLMFSVNSFNMEILILVDWVSSLFVSIVLLISSMIMLYSTVYMKMDMYINRFVWLVNLFVFSMILMIMSPNLISILFGWDGLGLTSYCLVIYYQNYISFNSGMVTVLCNRIGDIGLLMSIGLLIMYGSWNMIFPLNYYSILIILMIMLGALTKSAQIPFSVWLPMAMAAPTPVSALVHSSTLVTAGVYLLIRFNKFMYMYEMNKILLYISVLTMFMAGLMANFEIDLKKIIALSTLSQLGLMMMILSMGMKFLAFYHLLTHAVFKSLLFMCAGIMIHLMNSNQDIRTYGKLNEFIPFTMMSFYISSLALMGFPFLTGFYSKDLIMEVLYSMNCNFFMMILSMMSIMLTIMYSLRLMFYLFFKEWGSVSLIYMKEDKLMNISMMVLMMLSIVGGSLFFWIFFFDKYFIYLNLNIKMLTMSLMYLGMVFMGVIYLKNLSSIYFLSYFFSSMWMMTYLYMWIYNPFLKVGMISMKIEQEWMEFVSKDILLGFIKNMNLNFNFYKMYMIMFLFMMSILIGVLIL